MAWLIQEDAQLNEPWSIVIHMDFRWFGLLCRPAQQKTELRASSLFIISVSTYLTLRGHMFPYLKSVTPKWLKKKSKYNLILQPARLAVPWEIFSHFSPSTPFVSSSVPAMQMLMVHICYWPAFFFLSLSRIHRYHATFAHSVSGFKLSLPQAKSALAHASAILMKIPLSIRLCQTAGDTHKAKTISEISSWTMHAWPTFCFKRPLHRCHHPHHYSSTVYSQFCK